MPLITRKMVDTFWQKTAQGWSIDRCLAAAIDAAPDGNFTEGVSGDGVVILHDGLPLPISDVLALLNLSVRRAPMLINQWHRKQEAFL